jgi:hypothetical protein
MNLLHLTGRWPVRPALAAIGFACAAGVLAITCGTTAASAAVPSAGSSASPSAASQSLASAAKPRLQPGFTPEGKIKSFYDVPGLAATAAGRKQLQAYTAADGTTCSDDVDIMSYANGLYVSAEVGWAGARNGILRARASVIGPWELFRECWYVNTAGKYVFSLQSQANSKWVSIEYNYTGNLYEVLRARAATAGEWEHFYMGVPQNWHMDLQAVHLGRYVSVELGNTGDDYAILRARATAFGPWEDLGQA